MYNTVISTQIIIGDINDVVLYYFIGDIEPYDIESFTYIMPHTHVSDCRLTTINLQTIHVKTKRT